MTILISTISLIAAALIYALWRCGWHLSPPSHSCSHIEPTCFKKRDMRDSVENWRIIANACVVALIISAVMMFVKVVGAL